MQEDNDSRKGVKVSQITVAVIPAYNEAHSIKQVIDETLVHVSFLVVVDDGSNDGTLSKVPSSDKVIMIQNRRNIGKGGALKRGLMEALKLNPDIVITLDGDGQHKPEDIPKLLRPIQENYADVVVGSRYVGERDNKIPRYRRAGLYVINLLNKTLTQSSLLDTQSGFRAYSKDVLHLILQHDSIGYGLETEQLSRIERLGFRIAEVSVKIQYSGLGRTSKHHPVLHGTGIVSTIIKIAVERRPLLFFGLSGIFSLCLAAIFATQLLLIFNETRYFSLPLGLLASSVGFLGIMLILISFVLHVVNKINRKIS